jgi:hypothetical protein
MHTLQICGLFVRPPDLGIEGIRVSRLPGEVNEPGFSAPS